MAVGGSIAKKKQLAAMQQKKNIHVSKLPLASKKQTDQNEEPEESQHVPQHRRNVSTSTAYAEDTNVMEVTYTHPRHTHQDPLYTATHLAEALTTLTHPDLQGKEPNSPTIPPPASNPFALPPSSLETWHHARTTLGNPTYFYTTLLNNLPLEAEPRPEPEERFEVRTLECTLEIEQGLADLRRLLGECQRVGSERALEGLRARVRGAVEGW